MKRAHDPRRLDVAAFVADGGALSGQWPGGHLDRLAGLQAPPQDLPVSPVDWQVEGVHKPVAGGAAELWLVLSAQTSAWLCCQRCLQPMAWPLQVQRRIRFALTEAEAEALDAELEEDVLAVTRSLDLLALVEDELILALPIVPRHAHCPSPLPMSSAPQEVEAPLPEEHPFAALRSLKLGRSGG